MIKAVKTPGVQMGRCLVLRSQSKKRAYACGHTDAAMFELRIFGRTIPGQYLGQPDCPKCQLEKMLKEAYRCGVCGRGLFVGDVVRRCNVDLLRDMRWGRWMVVKPYINVQDRYAAVCAEHQARMETQLWRLGATDLEFIYL